MISALSVAVFFVLSHRRGNFFLFLLSVSGVEGQAVDVAWEMLNKIAQSGVIYFAFNTRINECENHHGFVGSEHCPVCGKPVFDTYQRIVGYLVPTRSYSKERFREFTTRQWYEYAEMVGE